MSNSAWLEQTIYEAFYCAGDKRINLFGASPSGGMYLLFDGKPYLIQIDATRLERPNLYLKESFHVARAVFERDDVYTTVITAFRKGLALYLLKVCNVRNQSLLAEPLKDYLMNNWERIQSS
tara:strand:- start:1044 stop:1409 length:366 start_codon:yes stop_codon:yes gene_type:complete